MNKWDDNFGANYEYLEVEGVGGVAGNRQGGIIVDNTIVHSDGYGHTAVLDDLTPTDIEFFETKYPKF